MDRALGDYIFIKPIEKTGNQWSGNIVDRGAKVVKFTTYYDCDLVIYNDEDIYKTTTYEGDRVHAVKFQNIRKIEGVY